MSERDVRQMTDDEPRAAIDLGKRCAAELQRRTDLDADLKAATEAAKARQS